VTYSNPAFGIIHALRETGAANITSNNAITNTEITYLLDSRVGELFTFDGSAANHYIDINRGAGPDAIDRMVVPSGHNWTGTIDLLADSVATFDSPATILLDDQAVSAGVLDISFASNSDQYIRLLWNGTGTWATPEFWLTKRRTMIAGPVWPWVDAWKYNVLDFPKPSGDIATLEQGTKQRFFGMSWEAVFETADISVFDDLFANAGRAKPYLFWPPYGEDPLIVKMTVDPDREAGVTVPGVTESENITLEMIELVA
jgi:hypothetical protein